MLNLFHMINIQGIKPYIGGDLIKSTVSSLNFLVSAVKISKSKTPSARVKQKMAEFVLKLNCLD